MICKEGSRIDFLLVANHSRLNRDLTAADAYLRWSEDRFVEVICVDGAVPQIHTEILLDLVKASRHQGTEL